MAYYNQDYEKILDEYYKIDMGEVREFEKAEYESRLNNFYLKHGKFIAVMFGLSFLISAIGFIYSVLYLHETIVTLSILLLFTLVGDAAYFYYRYKKATNAKKSERCLR